MKYLLVLLCLSSTNYLIVYRDASGNVIARGYSSSSAGDPCARAGTPGVTVESIKDGNPPDDSTTTDGISRYTFASGVWTARSAGAILAERAAKVKAERLQSLVQAHARMQAATAMAIALPADTAVLAEKSAAQTALTSATAIYQGP